MAELSTALSILKTIAKTSGFISGWWKSSNAAAEAFFYLKDKYQFEVVKSEKLTRNGDYITVEDYGPCYGDLIVYLIDNICDAYSVNDTLRLDCADLALGIFAAQHDLIPLGKKLYGTRLWENLDLIGRGFGEDYVLKTVKKELDTFKKKHIKEGHSWDSSPTYITIP